MQKNNTTMKEYTTEDLSDFFFEENRKKDRMLSDKEMKYTQLEKEYEKLEAINKELNIDCEQKASVITEMQLEHEQEQKLLDLQNKLIEKQEDVIRLMTVLEKMY